MALQFYEIPSQWYVGGSYAEVRPNYANKGIAPWPTKVLLYGHRLSSGTSPSLVKQPITRNEQATGFFGAGSQLESMVLAFRKANPYCELWAMGLDEAANATAAQYTITVGGNPGNSGIIPLWIKGIYVEVGVSPADTLSSIASDIAASITANPQVPFTATANGAVVTLTAYHKGTFGNNIDIRFKYYFDDVLPLGLTLTLAQTVQGATDPLVSSVFNLIPNDWFTDFVQPFTDSVNMALLEAELQRRYTALVKLDSHGYVGVIGTYATATTYSAQRNSPFVTPIPVSAKPLNAPWEWAASLAGVATFNLENDPARQLKSLTLPGILAPFHNDCFALDEQNLMLQKGLSAWDREDDNSVTLNRVVTSYTKSTEGAADTAWLDIMTPKTMSRIRYDWINYLTLTYPRAKLAMDGSALSNTIDPNAGILTPRTALGSWIGRCALYQNQGWIMDMDYTKQNSSFEIDANDKNRLDAVLAVKVIGNDIVNANILEFAA